MIVVLMYGFGCCVAWEFLLRFCRFELGRGFVRIRSGGRFDVVERVRVKGFLF